MKEQSKEQEGKEQQALNQQRDFREPPQIDVDDDSCQVSMLDIRHGEVDLQQEKWSSQKEQKSMELQLQQEKWKSESKQQNLEYKFDLMVKYRKLQEQDFDNHQIVKMIPDMRPIIDMANMPVHLQLSPEEHDAEAYKLTS
jgi:hypothetical protein